MVEVKDKSSLCLLQFLLSSILQCVNGPEYTHCSVIGVFLFPLSSVDQKQYQIDILLCISLINSQANKFFMFTVHFYSYFRFINHILSSFFNMFFMLAFIHHLRFFSFYLSLLFLLYFYFLFYFCGFFASPMRLSSMSIISLSVLIQLILQLLILVLFGICKM